MKKTLLFGLSLTVVLSSAGLFSSIEAQEPEGPEKWDPNWEPPRTAWGHPDLQGNWSNATLTRFCSAFPDTDAPAAGEGGRCRLKHPHTFSG